MALESSPVEDSAGQRIAAVLMRQDVILLGIFAAMVAFFSAINPRYFSLPSAANILQDF